MPAYIDYGFVRTPNLVREKGENHDDGFDDKSPSPFRTQCLQPLLTFCLRISTIPGINHYQWLDFGFCFCWKLYAPLVEIFEVQE